MLLADVRGWLSRRSAAAPRPGPAGEARLTHAGAAPAPSDPSLSPKWPPARLALTHRLWGEGFVGPGGAEEVLRLAAPLGLSAASSLLLVGCGAGGPARCIATLFGAWIAGYEADPALAAEAAAVCARAGLGKRVQVGLWDPAAPAFRAQSCHHALVLEPFRQGGLGGILDALTRAVRAGGQVTLLATVAGPGFDLAVPEVAAWLRLDGGLPALPEVDTVTQALRDRRLDVRVVEDLSAAHLRQTLHAWHDLVRSLRAEDSRPTASLAEPLVREAELWLRRARLVRSGKLRWVRWHAIGRAG